MIFFLCSFCSCFQSLLIQMSFFPTWILQIYQTTATTTFSHCLRTTKLQLFPHSPVHNTARQDTQRQAQFWKLQPLSIMSAFPVVSQLHLPQTDAL